MFTLGFEFGADSVRALYRELCDRLGGLTKSAGLARVLKDLIDIKHERRLAA
jgi:hypothetical protein